MTFAARLLGPERHGYPNAMAFDAPIDGQATSGSAPAPAMHLPLDDRSVKMARDEVAGRLRRAGWSSEGVERARVVTSELATNALVHAGTAFDLEVRIDPAAHQVWIGVADEASADRPVYAERDRTRPGGMGLYLVDAMALSWGMDLADQGKVVWACLRDED